MGLTPMQFISNIVGVPPALLQPNPWMILPFVLLLGTIALAPLLAADWWLRNYAKVALALGGITLVYYLAGLGAYSRVMHVAHEYVSFIALIGGLYVVSGGIHIRVKGEATPAVNTIFLLIGGIIANVLGTTGASMLLIRPWIRMNKYRITAHHIVFFIFVVSNLGGCLTPIGDPPLFMGYLKGVPFWWVAHHCWPMWAVGIGALLATFYVLDKRNFQRAPAEIREQETAREEWKFDGLGNIFFLAVILGAVFIERPIFLREALMIGAALGSYFTTRKSVHEANDFNFHPIEEVAILFVGIFATMMPALDWLEIKSAALGQPSPGFFYWGSGSLSAVLDNVPTYLSFLKAIFGSSVNPDVIQQVQQLIQSGGMDLATVVGPHAEQVRQTVAALQTYHAAALQAGMLDREHIEVAYLIGNAQYNHYILAISIGAVFFGACTYIGNGPNFMVKSIAEQQKVHVPGFLGYVFRFTVPFLLPVLALVWLIFFRS
jgi:Na+/H+ antiporter NhaD/arsenite permease-like protein